MPFRLPILTGCLLACLSLTGCFDRPDPVPSTLAPASAAEEAARRDSVIAFLNTTNRTAIDEAFRALDQYAYTRTTTVEHRDADDQPVASKTQVVRFGADGSARRMQRVSVDSSGTFEDGLFGWFSERAVPAEDTTGLATFILSDDPPYLSGRGREAFRFRTMPDTTLNGRTTRRVTIEAHPVEGQSQHLRRVQLAIDEATGELVGINVVRDQHSLLYGERSHFRLQLMPLSDGTWVPAALDLDTRLGSMAFGARRYRARSTYEDYEPIPTG